MQRIMTILGVVAILALSAVARGPALPALACSGDGSLPPAERFQDLATRRGSPDGLVVLGQVVAEHQVDPARRGGLVPPESWVAQFRIEVVLNGQPDAQTISVGPTGFGNPDCTGGPRILAGEKLILFLGPIARYYHSPVDGVPSDSGDWQGGQLNFPILFDGEDAYYIDWGRFTTGYGDVAKDKRWKVGGSADVLTLALDFAAASAEERARAFQFVLGISPPAPPPSATSTITPPSAGDGGLLAGR